MKTLIYCGVNRGGTFWSLCPKYDLVLGFEAQPNLHELLVSHNRFQHVEIINAAVWNEDGEKDFFVTTNEVSSSLGTLEDKYFLKFIKVKTLNLFNYLQERGIEEITTYLSDIQGADLTVLKTLSPYIESKKISEIIVETHNNETEIYKGLYNSFDGFKTLLGTNYKVKGISCDGTPYNGLDTVDSKYQEFDVHWILK